ncbi:hypothetical protein [Cellulomonas uda]|uniref:Integral membrane protein n=1 Tax=Cellulomonas uda TaxID=1714 RepID=A0A4Y3KAA5_CELUD|nr:hypothetical protein [Cellulomonas uda]NII67382.1 hypothetical protein [Cellulomonas uda]GEA79898.1 hypothetical protein CUD01_03420 [Cellulomonas uda]
MTAAVQGPAQGSAQGAAQGSAQPTGEHDVVRPARRWWDPRTWAWWVQVLAVYALARGLTAVLVLQAAAHQGATPWADAHPSYAQMTGLFWDAGWYHRIADEGYPDTLPVDEAGRVQQSAWAFFPLYPMLVRGLMAVTTLGWEVVAPTTSLLLGAAAMLLVHRAVAHGAPRACAAWPGLPLATVVLVAVFPTSPVLQVAYTESLALLLVAAALLLLVRRHYLECAGVLVLLGLTRAVALPMAVVVGVHLLARWVAARRGREAFPGRDVAQVLGLGVVAVVSGFAWPAVCGWVTGVPEGYLRTQEAWRGVREVTPFGGWDYVLRFWFGDAGWWVLAAAAVFVVALLVVPAARRLGPELHAWPAAYLLYLAAAIEPGSSLARFLVLAFPAGAITAGVVRRPGAARWAWFAGVVVLMLVLQAVWVWRFWRLTSGWPP